MRACVFVVCACVMSFGMVQSKEPVSLGVRVYVVRACVFVSGSGSLWVSKVNGESVWALDLSVVFEALRL